MAEQTSPQPASVSSGLSAHPMLSRPFWDDVFSGVPVHLEAALPMPDPLVLSAALHREGYFVYTGVASPFLALVQTLRSGISRLVARGLHPLWILLCDEAWDLTRCFADIIQKVGGPDLALNWDFWAWHLDPVREEAGFPPHRDRSDMTFAGDGGPHYLTLWTALSDATRKNGCMYVLPRQQDPSYDAKQALDMTMSPDTERALEARAGTVLGWTGRLLHRGGRAARDAPEARVSIACAASAPSYESPDLRLALNPGERPPLDARVRLVVTQFLAYDCVGLDAAQVGELARIERAIEMLDGRE